MVASVRNIPDSSLGALLGLLKGYAGLCSAILAQARAEPASPPQALAPPPHPPRRCQSSRPEVCAETRMAAAGLFIFLASSTSTSSLSLHLVRAGPEISGGLSETKSRAL